jgi:hypothetical protein
MSSRDGHSWRENEARFSKHLRYGEGCTMRKWMSNPAAIVPDMIGALVTHVRAGDPVAKMAPAAISLVLLVLTAWSTRRTTA